MSDRPIWYKLVDKKPVAVDVMDAALALERDNRHVAQTKLKGGVIVSTVFLGIDHAISGRPVLFETMVFGGPLGGSQERYYTWDEAVEGHGRWVVAVKAQEQPHMQPARDERGERS